MKFTPANLSLPQASKSVKAAIVIMALVLLAGGVYASTYLTHNNQSHPTVTPKTVSDQTGKSLPAATQSPSTTPTPSTTAAHTNTATSKAVTKQIATLAPRVFTPLVPMDAAPVSTPTPTIVPSASTTPSPTPTYDPQVETWFYTYASSLFNNIYTTFEKMGTDANNSDINGIVSDCQTEIIWAHDLQYNEPPVPLSGLNLSLDINLNGLTEGSQYCVEGINTGNSDEAVNGINGMQDAILGLISLQQEMVPSN